MRPLAMSMPCTITQSLPPRYVVSIITYSSASYCMLCAFSINQQQFFVMARVKPLWVASNDDNYVGIVGAVWVGIWRSEVWLQTQHMSPLSCTALNCTPLSSTPHHTTPLHSTPLVYHVPYSMQHFEGQRQFFCPSLQPLDFSINSKITQVQKSVDM